MGLLCDNRPTLINERRKMIKVNEYNVDTVDCTVSVDEQEYESRESLFDHIEEEYGLEDIDDNNIKEEQYDDDDSIILKGDVWFIQWDIISED